MITGHSRNKWNIMQDWMLFIKKGLEVVNPSGCYLQHNGRESCINRHGVAGNYTERWNFVTFSIFYGSYSTSPLLNKQLYLESNVAANELASYPPTLSGNN